MRILYIAPSPPNSMSRIRTQNIIKAMQQLGHQVTLVSFVYNDGDISTLEKYSLQGTTQSRYLTGGVPPVRFSM